MKWSREYFVPKGAVKISDKLSDAVAYVYEVQGALYALGFHGRAQKPDWHFRYRTLQEREKRIARHFESARQHAASRSEQRKARSKPHKFEVGHIFNTNWGYDQTNIEYFQVVEVPSPQYVVVREIAKLKEETAFMQGRCFPKADQFIGEPLRRRVVNNSVKIDDVRRAWLWECRPGSWSSYA